MASEIRAMNKQRYSAGHLGGLRRFSVGITVLTIVGHAYLGFEMSYAVPLVALATGYSMQIFLEILDAKCSRRRLRFSGGLRPFVDFLLSAHISSLAVAMLLYANDRLWVIAFAVSVAIASKTVFRAPVGLGTRHFFNPSNLALSVTLTVFPWVGLGLPYQFTEALTGAGDWILYGILFCLGSFLNARFTKRVPVVVAFLGAFVLQAILRALWFGTPILAGLAPVTGVMAVLYVFFMVPDPATTPVRPLAQVAFGVSVAAVYAVFMMLHIVYGLFFALTVVCAARGIGLYALAIASKRGGIQEVDGERLTSA